MTDPDTSSVAHAEVTNVEVASRDPTLAVISILLGIFAICTAWIPLVGLIAWVLAPLGLMIGLGAFRRSAGPARGVAIAGMISSAIGVLGCIVPLFLFPVLFPEGVRFFGGT